jgi:hypothetical protein
MMARRTNPGLLPKMQSTTDDKQTEALRKMTPTQKWMASMSIYWSARSLKAAFLRREHPAWTEEMISTEVTRLFSLGHE